MTNVSDVFTIWSPNVRSVYSCVSHRSSVNYFITDVNKGVRLHPDSSGKE